MCINSKLHIKGMQTGASALASTNWSDNIAGFTTTSSLFLHFTSFSVPKNSSDGFHQIQSMGF